MKKSIKIALVDDERLFLEGLTLLLSDTGNIKLIATEGDGKQFLKKLENLPAQEFPDIVMVDLQMKPMDGFELVEGLKNEYPDLKIIILSSHYKHAMFGHMIKMGVSAFLPKNATKGLLLQAIENVYQSGVFFTEQDQHMLIDYMRNNPKNPGFGEVDMLSERETEVMKLICMEKTSPEIADQLFISKRTVENHRQRILEKIGAKNTVGIVVYAIINNIYKPPLSL